MWFSGAAQRLITTLYLFCKRASPSNTGASHSIKHVLGSAPERLRLLSPKPGTLNPEPEVQSPEPLTPNMLTNLRLVWVSMNSIITRGTAPVAASLSRIRT
jgi:hypothetical protein